MPATSGQPEGFGTPSGGQPGFTPPAPGPTVPRPAVPGPRVWSVTKPPLVVAPPPSGRGPHHARRARLRWVAALLAAGLVLIGIFSALPLVPSTGPAQQQSSATPAAVDTVTPSTAPGSASTATSGGDLGRQVTFATGAGKGTVTVRSVRCAAMRTFRQAWQLLHTRQTCLRRCAIGVACPEDLL